MPEMQSKCFISQSVPILKIFWCCTRSGHQSDSRQLTTPSPHTPRLKNPGSAFEVGYSTKISSFLSFFNENKVSVKGSLTVAT